MVQEMPDLQLSAWAMESSTQLEDVNLWYQNGETRPKPSGKSHKQHRINKMLASKVPGFKGGAEAEATRPRGSILVATHKGFEKIFRRAQLDIGDQHCPKSKEALRQIISGAGLVIMDEAHEMRTNKTNVSCLPLCMNV